MEVNLFISSIAKNNEIISLRRKKSVFLAISRQMSILDHMLLHKLYINVAIANILLYSKSLYDLQKRRYDFFI